jgi:hypothetical protein
VKEAPVNRSYDLFERLPDGQLLWRCSASGLENARAALTALAQETKNECLAMDLSTREIAARANQPDVPSSAGQLQITGAREAEI